MNEYDVKVYFEKNKIYTDLDVLVQNDYNSTKLNFTFDKTGSRVLFKLKAPNGDNILNTQIVNNEIILEPGVLSQVGDYEAEISLYGNDSKLTNYQTLNFYVRDVLINTDEIIEPSHEKEILDQLINDVNTLESTVNTNEATRQSNEQTRVSNENTRISNETTRQSNETEREEYIDQLKQDVEDGKFDGEDGYTPQKGIDYYTEEEKEEMIDYIVNDANSEFNRNVNEKTTAFNTNATNKTTDFNSNASSKLDTYNSNHTSKMNAYNQNATDKTTAYDNNASSKLGTYNDNATEKLTAYNSNHTEKITAYNENANKKLSAYNTNHTEKLQAYNDNASDKLDEYNDNAQEKIDEFNENKEELQREVDYYKSTLNALPKVEGEGTELTLDDTAEAPMTMKLAPSELEQETTSISGGDEYDSPSPEHPQDIHTISGDNEIKVENKNLCKLEDSNLFPNSSGTVVNQDRTSNLILEVGNNINLSINGNFSLLDSGVVRIGGYNKYPILGLAGTRLTNVDNSNKTINVSNYKYILISFLMATVSVTKEKIENSFQVEWGTPTNYVPHEEQSLPLNLPVENLLNKNNYVSIDGKIGIDISNLVIGKTYTFSSNIAINTFKISNTYTGYNSVYNNNVNGFKDYTFVMARDQNISESETQYLYIKLDSNNWATNITQLNDFNLQIEQGTKANSYTPYGTPALEYSKIGDYEDEFVIPSGKNKFNMNTTVYTRNAISSYSFSNGVYTLIPTGTGNPNITLDVSIPAGTYILNSKKYLSVASVLTNKNGVSLKNFGSNYTNMSFTITEESALFSFNWGNPGNTNPIILDLTSLIISEDGGDYEPYNDGKWYLKKNVGKVVLDGSENWVSYDQTIYSGDWTYYITIPTIKKNFTGLYCLSNNFKYIDSTVIRLNTFSAGGNTTAKNGNMIFSIGDTENKLNEFKIWLSTHNTEVYYPLEEPTYIPLNDTLQSQLTEIYKWVKAYQDQTNISQVNNDLPFVIKASAIKDLNKVIASLTNAIIEIGGE